MNTRLIIGALIVIIGISILLDLNLFEFLIPLLIIWIGVQIIMGKDGTSNSSKLTEAQEDSIKRVLVFSGLNQAVQSDNFKGGEIVAVFGSVELDLSQVKTKEKNLKLELVSVFGSVEIKVPENWTVNSEGVGILGSFDNKANGGQTKKTVTADIKGISVLGSVEVRN